MKRLGQVFRFTVLKVVILEIRSLVVITKLCAGYKNCIGSEKGAISTLGQESVNTHGELRGSSYNISFPIA